MKNVIYFCLSLVLSAQAFGAVATSDTAKVVGPRFDYMGWRYLREGDETRTFMANFDVDKFKISELMQPDGDGDYSRFLDEYVDHIAGTDLKKNKIFLAMTGPQGKRGRSILMTNSALWAYMATLVAIRGPIVRAPLGSPYDLLELGALGLLTYKIFRTRHEREAYSTARIELRKLTDDLRSFGNTFVPTESRTWKLAIFQWDILSRLIEGAFGQEQPERTLQRIKVLFKQLDLAPLGMLIRWTMTSKEYSANRNPEWTDLFNTTLKRDRVVNFKVWREWYELAEGDFESLPPDIVAKLKAEQRVLNSNTFVKSILSPFAWVGQKWDGVCERYLRRKK